MSTFRGVGPRGLVVVRQLVHGFVGRVQKTNRLALGGESKLEAPSDERVERVVAVAIRCAKRHFVAREHGERFRGELEFGQLEPMTNRDFGILFDRARAAIGERPTGEIYFVGFTRVVNFDPVPRARGLALRRVRRVELASSLEPVRYRSRFTSDPVASAS